MNLKPAIHESRSTSGLTLIEILVAVTLLIVIMAGLMAMFDQTQKVFVAGMRQTDVMEGGRSAVELIGRDFEQMAAGGRPGDTNFYAWLRPWPTFGPSDPPAQVMAPDGNSVLKALTLQDVFFLSHPSSDWSAIGYKVLDPNAPDTEAILMGALYRFGTNTTLLQSTNFFRTFQNPYGGTANTNLITSGQMSRVIDGVVHFKVVAYDHDGIRFPATNNFADLFVGYVTNALIRLDPVSTYYEFSQRRLPTTVEVEIGVLEPEAVIRARALPGIDAAWANNFRKFLGDNSGKIHLFRQRIPIRVAASFGN
jgi:hypothetical protein